MNAKILLTAFFAAIFGALVGRYVGSGDGRSITDDDALSTGTPESEAARELRDAAIAIKEAADALKKSARTSPSPMLPAPVGTPTAESAPTETRSIEAKIDRWMAAMERIVAVGQASSGADRTPLREWATSTDPQQKALTSKYSTDEQATRALLLLTQRQILQTIGYPESISTSGDGVVWSYPDGSVMFGDGLVTYVGVYTPSVEDGKDPEK
jgi:hypothetical protein